MFITKVFSYYELIPVRLSQHLLLEYYWVYFLSGTVPRPRNTGMFGSRTTLHVVSTRPSSLQIVGWRRIRISATCMLYLGTEETKVGRRPRLRMSFRLRLYRKARTTSIEGEKTK